MKIEAIKCLKCGQIFQSKEKDLVFICNKCGAGQIRDRDSPEEIPYEVAAFGQQSGLTKVYLPFWRVYASVAIGNEKIEGGGLFRLAEWLTGGTGNSGYAFIYMPAFELEPQTFKQWAMQYTSNPPRYAPQQGFGGNKRVPLTIKREEAVAMADFVIVTHEAEKPGVLQQLNYSMTINEIKLMYLPFYWDGKGYFAGL
jgi:hypothetical protein